MATMEDLTPAAVKDAPVWAIHEDRAGAVWVGTARGLIRLEGDRVAAHLTTRDGLPSDDVKVIHESTGADGQSVFWFGTYGGLARLEGGRFTVFTTADGLAGDRVRSILEDADGTLWIGTYDDGLSRYRDGKFVNYRTEQGLFNNGVFQILEDRHGNFWIGSNKGIYPRQPPRAERHGRGAPVADHQRRVRQGRWHAQLGVQRRQTARRPGRS